MNARPDRFSVGCDFDGVIHQYVTPWVSAEVIPDPPMPGALDWLREVMPEYNVVILTTRGASPEGRFAVADWLRDHGLDLNGFSWSARDDHFAGIDGLGERLIITARKFPCLIYVDDRGWRFAGKFPNMKTIRYLKPWRIGDPPKENVRVKLGGQISRIESKQTQLKGEIRYLRAELLREVLRGTYTDEGVEVWLKANAELPFAERLEKARATLGMIAT